MKIATRVIEEIEEFLSNDEYEKALEVVNLKALALVEILSVSSIHNRLLLLIAKVYCLKGKHKEFNLYLSRFESLYSDNKGNIDYIILKYYKLILDGSTQQAIDFINLSLKKK